LAVADFSAVFEAVLRGFGVVVGRSIVLVSVCLGCIFSILLFDLHSLKLREEDSLHRRKLSDQFRNFTMGYSPDIRKLAFGPNHAVSDDRGGV
jgi:hypothetical protein